MTNPESTEPPEAHVKDMEERLDSLETEIDEAERKAEDAVPHKSGPAFIDPGTEGTEDVDNAIAPPG